MMINPPSILDLNAQAIDLLRVGNHDNAIVKLQEALELMRSLLQESVGRGVIGKGGALVRDAVDQSRPICVPVGTRASSAMYERTVEEEEEGARDRFAGSVFRFFDRAFALSVSDVVTCENRTSCVILYNLALGHSLSWLETCDATDLSMAIKLYKMALAVMENCTGEDPSLVARDDYVLLQLLAIFNNLGYLQHYQAEEERHLCPQQGTIEQPQDGLTQHCVGAIRALVSTRCPPLTSEDGHDDASQEAGDIVIVTAAAAATQQQRQQDHHSCQDDVLFFRWSVLFLFQRLAMKIAPAA